VSEFWEAELSQTVRNTERLIQRKTRGQDAVDWLAKYADVGPTSSNQGAAGLPFQRWFHFKEAFSPKFVADVLGSVPYRVDRCLDPFGGSGTTALTCRMLGLKSVTVEVNPFLADLIRAKLAPISAATFTSEYEAVVSYLRPSKTDEAPIPGMPATLKQPGVAGKFVFSEDVYRGVRAILRRSGTMQGDHARLLRVLLGSVLVPNSNVTINGKGRRYRRESSRRPKTAANLVGSLDDAVDMATTDLTEFAGLPRGQHRVLRGDSRSELSKVSEADIAIFSPPYPNSFDYTDVYNLELWMLGYLGSSGHNTALRQQTLRSHVQTRWTDTPRAATSKRLQAVIRSLSGKRAELWNRHLPEMIGFYFDDLYAIFRHMRRILKPGHHVVVVIGDSQYAGVHVDVGKILVECVADLGFRLIKKGEIRSMRTSSQHGGKFDLSEHCLVFERS
jgi:DNA modification methylase